MEVCGSTGSCFRRRCSPWLFSRGENIGVNVFVLYLLLLKVIVTTFSGLASVPVLRHDLVPQRHLLTDRDLNTSLAIGRTTPGPLGLYVVSVGYFVGRTAGAIAGWLAMITPALIIIPLLEFVRKKAEHPRFRAMLRNVMFASAGLLLWVIIPLAHDAIRSSLAVAIALVAFGSGISNKVDSLWILLGAALGPKIASFEDSPRLTPSLCSAYSIGNDSTLLWEPNSEKLRPALYRT